MAAGLAQNVLQPDADVLGQPAQVAQTVVDYVVMVALMRPTGLLPALQGGDRAWPRGACTRIALLG
ncbi:MAG: hypothetical protein ACXWN4_03935 [Candidatus Limnocylindrales bacterium]